MSRQFLRLYSLEYSRGYMCSESIVDEAMKPLYYAAVKLEKRSGRRIG